MSPENITDFYNVTTTLMPDSFTDAPSPSAPSRLRFVIVPLGIIVALILFSSVVIMIVRRKRLDKLRHHLVPLYNFEPGECEDWEAELLEEPGEQKSQKKIQDYNSMGVLKEQPTS